MFNDRYDLTLKVLRGQKTQTRREVPEGIMRMAKMEVRELGGDLAERIKDHTPYCYTEKVAIAQSYHELAKILAERGGKRTDDKLDKYYLARQSGRVCDTDAGWNNKMFVKADLMPHQVRITGIKVERLQDISTNDCLAEGLDDDCGEGIHPYWWSIDHNKHEDWRKISDEVACHGFDRHGKPCTYYWETAQSAYKALIDRLDKTMWERNPLVFAYTFELIR